MSRIKSYRILRPAAGDLRPELRRAILRLAGPAAGEELFAILTQMADTALVGPLGPVAVAAVGMVFQFQWLVMGLFLGLGAGVTALVARAIGAGEERRAEDATRQGFWLAAVLAALAGLALWIYAEAIYRAFGLEPPVVAAGTQYLRAATPGLAAMLCYLVLGDALRAAGDTRTPFRISLVVNGLNVALDAVLIYGLLGAPALGVVGAGLASSIARLLGLGLLLLVLLRGRSRVHLHPGRLGQVELALMGRLVQVGLPVAADRLLGAGGYVIYLRIVVTLGTVAAAAHHVAVVAEQISWVIGVGFATAVAALVGQSLGARDPDRAQAIIAEACRLGVLVLGSIGLFFIILPGPYLRLFTRETAVLGMAAVALRITGLGQVPMILSEVLQGALAGAGDTRLLFWISLFGAWAVRLGLAALFVLHLGWGLAGAWAASVVDWGARLVLLWLRLRSGRWQQLRV